MSPATYNTTCRHLGLTQARIARLLHVDVHTPSRWACGQARVPRAVVLLLRAMQHGHLTIEDLEALGRNAEAPKPREPA